MTDRYARQTALPEMGEAGQQRLQRATVLVVGVGGLGCPVCQYLCGAGVGRLVLVDDDAVSLSNLHRQVLYAESEVGLPKAECAARRLRALNGRVLVEARVTRFTAATAEALLCGCDLVIDGTDNYATRYVIDDAARRMGIPYLYGAVGAMEGQVALLGVGTSPRYYRDLYPAPPPASADKSVLGPTPAVVGGVMAAEALRLLSGATPALAGRLWSIDLRTLQSFILNL